MIHLVYLAWTRGQGGVTAMTQGGVAGGSTIAGFGDSGEWRLGEPSQVHPAAGESAGRL